VYFRRVFARAVDMVSLKKQRGGRKEQKKKKKKTNIPQGYGKILEMTDTGHWRFMNHPHAYASTKLAYIKMTGCRI
jgi:hypothetical protein